MSMDAWEIREELKNRLERLLDEFLPGGSSDGHYYRTSGVHGGDGKSMVVHLTRGTKWERGDFYENNPKGDETYTNGSVLDLFMAANNIKDVSEGIKKAKSWCGIYEPKRISAYPKQQGGKDTFKPAGEHIVARYKVDPVMPESIVGKYLTQERGIPLEILRKYHVGQAKVPIRNKAGEWEMEDAFVFRFRDCEGNFAGNKYILVKRDEKNRKIVTTDKGMDESRQHLWGMDAVPSDARELLICEGEIDALSAASCGFNAVSIPFGAKGDGNKWIENDFEWLDRFTLIKVCMDSDEAGRKSASAIVPRLNYMRTEQVEVFEPYNDLNDLFLANPEYLTSAVENSKAFTPERLRRARDYAKDIWEEFFPEGGEEPGDPLPFNCPDFRIRPGEMSIFSGYQKSGKTVMLSWITNCHAAAFGRRVGIASMELKPQKTLRNIMRQAIGQRKPLDANGEPDRKLFEDALEYLDEHFFMFDCVGRAKIREILEVFSFAVRKYGLSTVIIDSLMKLDVGKDDYQRQSDVVDEMANWARDMNVHLFLVAHSRKPQNKDNQLNHVPYAEEVEGSGDIIKQVHNILVAFRCRKKEESMKKAMLKNDTEQIEKLKDEADAMFVVRGQREGDGQEPIKHLFYDLESWQYGEERDFSPLNLIQMWKDRINEEAKD